MNKTSIHQLIENQALKTPNAIAVSFQNQSITYQVLNQRANQLAHHLKALGIETEMLVGLCINRSIEMVVALLGILKAGGAYVPLDPTYPSERLAITIEDAELPFIITQQHLVSLIPKNQSKTILLDQDLPTISQQPIVNLDVSVEPHNLAYVLYTSGSTGRPKGVAIEHRNTLALINWASESYTADQLKGVLASTSLCFDLSVFELFVTLSRGGKVIVVRNALDLPNVDSESDITLINTVPSAISELLRIKCIPTSVKTINLAGEPLQNALVQQIYQLDHVEKVFNLYGPSEDTTYSTSFLVPKGAKGIPSIGKPISNTHIYLLGSDLNLVPEGTEGEIHISGKGLARGYLNRPDLTAQKFIRNPFDAEANSRLYKTGDLAAYDSDGNLKFFGRIDHQVKIRGFRIELGEIESLLLQHYAINQVVVIAREDSVGGKRLVAYIVPDRVFHQQYTVTSSTLSRLIRAFLSQKLPDYMVPSAFILLDQLPLTLNGKIDRRALPVPAWTGSEVGKYVGPKTDTENRIAKIWGNVLGLSPEKIGIHDTFDEIGGNSLLSVRVVAEINEQFEAKVSLCDFLEAHSIEKLSRIVDSRLQGNTTKPALIDLSSEGRLSPDIAPQEALSSSIPEILLTGATGFLGIFLLSELLKQTRADVHCLVRATTFEEAKAKLWNKLKKYGLWKESFCDRILPLIGDLSKPSLGLSANKFFRLSEKIDLIYHCGAWVNIAYPYDALKATNVDGTEEVLRLACQNRPKPFHFISTVDVYPVTQSTGTISASEQSNIGPGEQLYSGYAQSKYVAEKLVVAAGERGLPVAIYRPSNILGPLSTGVYSADSFVIKMIQGCIQMEAAPEIEALLNTIPVDYASEAIVHLSQQQDLYGRSMNIVNSESMAWNDLIEFVREVGYSLERLPYDAWYAELLKTDAKMTVNAIAPLATLFSNRKFIQKALGAFDFESSSTQRRLTDYGITCPPAKIQLVDNYLRRLNIENLDSDRVVVKRPVA